MGKFGIMLFLFLHLIFQVKADKNPVARKTKKVEIEYFKGSFNEALQKAKKEGKMVFIDSYTSWCGPCKHLKNNILPNESLAQYINENYVPLAINIEKGEGPKLKRKYPHYTFPTLLFIKNDGRLKNKFSGLPTFGAQELLNFAKIASK